MKAKPSKKALAFLRWFCREDYIEEIEGDLTELFKQQHARSPRIAQWQFIGRVMKCFRPKFLKPLKSRKPNSFGMYKNHFKVAWRNLQRHSSFTFIRVAGLTLGISAA